MWYNLSAIKQQNLLYMYIKLMGEQASFFFYKSNVNKNFKRDLKRTFKSHALTNPFILNL